jgi:hypothetical protein
MDGYIEVTVDVDTVGQEEEKFMANHLKCLIASAGLMNRYVAIVM